MNWLQSLLAVQLLWVVLGSPIKKSDGFAKNKNVSEFTYLRDIRPSKTTTKVSVEQHQLANQRIDDVSEILASKFNKKPIPKKIKYFKINGKKQAKKSEMMKNYYDEKPEVVYSTLPNSFFPSVMPLIPYIPRDLEPPTRDFEHATRFIVPPVTIEVLPPRRSTKYVLKPNSLH